MQRHWHAPHELRLGRGHDRIVATTELQPAQKIAASFISPRAVSQFEVGDDFAELLRMARGRLKWRPVLWTEHAHGQ
jgi:hypothetical protein